ncbi:glycoside hydrolase family 43 protein [Paenibacillus sp. N4]|uniref:glycoside hydrolase family 43 protein n=1 Tax=Paenibacillus vietnamensis TaxID=2590547 RepID=UPI001CD08214|nr:glycoside hydrolase family 43 protein [Paenibacillus vietnamensis]MCA0755875.1 glycoside hydrolase family 43 protein [Paenibacillus vietnamensis]
MSRTYNNPILPGFHPDPSIVRVGEDYYMVNSTFQYFPAIVISHSRDLVHWEYIGHAIARSEHIRLEHLPDSFGIWAPDISFHEGVFYIFATLRLEGAGRANIMMKSERPEGPYSAPVVINDIGLDPSHFIDDDGTRYMAYGSKGVTIVKLNEESSEAVEEPVHLWEGTGRVAPEGPHILKKDEYYYVILAEGGTEYGHCVTAARSTSLFGPYEPCPFNPVHTQTDPQAPIQRAGHGKLVQTGQGDWWIVHLGGRPLGGGYCTLGRETFLEPVQWTEEGWFTVNQGRGPALIQEAPPLEQVVYREPALDEFAEGSLPLHWQFVRNPDEGNVSFTERDSHVRIWTGAGDLDTIQAKNVIVRREQHHSYTASMKLEFKPERDGEQAGLVCYYDSRCFIKLCSTYDNGLKLKLIENRARQLTNLGAIEVTGDGPIYLKAAVNGMERTFYYSYDNTGWIEAGRIPDALFLSDEGTQEKKAFTGTMVGFYAGHGGSGRRIAADIDWFLYEPQSTLFT